MSIEFQSWNSYVPRGTVYCLTTQIPTSLLASTYGPKSFFIFLIFFIGIGTIQTQKHPSSMAMHPESDIELSFMLLLRLLVTWRNATYESESERLLNRDALCLCTFQG